MDVGLLTWNSRDMTVETLRELLGSDQGCDLRVLVRDNASDDGTAEAIAQAFPAVEVDVGPNVGFAAGVNTLLRRSTAPWFFLLTSDARPAPRAIEALVRCAQRHPHAAAVAPRLQYPDGSLQHSTHPFPSVRVAAIASFRRNRISSQRADELFLEGTWMHDRERRVDWAIGAALLIPRDAYAAVGGLDERFFMYAEDLEWCWRARKLGWEIWFEPSAVVTHEMGVSGTKRFGGDRARILARNALTFYRGEHSLPSTVAWWALGVGGAMTRWARLRMRGDHRADLWKAETAAQLRAWRQ